MKYAEFKKTGVWQHFLRAEDGQSARCLLCPNKIIKCAGGSTKGLHTHVSACHPAENSQPKDHKQQSAPTPPPVKKVKTQNIVQKLRVTDYFKPCGDESLEFRVARMAAKDNMSFNTLASSEDLRYLFTSKYGKFPESKTTIQKIVTDFETVVFTAVKQRLASRKADNAKFTLTFDEWTSIRNRRFMNINLYDYCEADGGRVFYNLGLVRISDSMPAVKCLQLLTDRLAEYGLDLSDIFAFCTDGARLMTRVGKDADILHQTCFAHGIHLAVCDVLYDNNTNSASIETENSDSSSDDGQDSGFNSLTPSVKGVIDKVRCIVRLFRKSPLANDKLQFFVRDSLGKELTLVRDVKTRWNSLCDMLERFLKIQTCVQQALLALHKEHLFPSAAEIMVIESVCEVLLPIITGLKRLNRLEMDLATADRVAEFVRTRLTAMADKSSLNKEVLARWDFRTKERSTIMTQILIYLQTGHNGSLSLQKVKSFAMCVLQRVRFCLEPDSAASSAACATDNSGDSCTSAAARTGETLSDQLDVFLEKPMDTYVSNGSPPLDRVITKEIDYFKITGKRGEILNHLMNWLKTVPPTSVESERAFSVAGAFCTKVRNRLNDKALNSLCILKWFFSQDFLKC